MKRQSNINAKKLKFSINNLFSKCDQIRSFLRIWSHLLKKSLMKNCAVYLNFRKAHLSSQFKHGSTYSNFLVITEKLINRNQGFKYFCDVTIRGIYLI